MRFINEFLGEIIEKCGKDIGFELIKALCSVIFAFRTQNIRWTLFYIFGTTVFDVLTRINEKISLDNIINKIFKFSNLFKYTIYILIAISPTVANWLAKEMDYSNLLDFLIKRSYNLLPNLFGALIVCSFIKYLAQFKVEEITGAAIRSKKELFDIIMRGGFMIAILNAVNHAIRNEQKFTEGFNAFHLFVVIFSAIVILGAFALWLSNNSKPDFNQTKIYPTDSLFWCFCFLLSCILIPVVFKNANSEWLLLCSNAITSLIVSWSFLIFIKRKYKINLKDCPNIQLILFSIGVIGIILYSINNMETSDKDSMIRQLISGMIISAGAITILLFINSIQKKNLNLNT